MCPFAPLLLFNESLPPGAVIAVNTGQRFYKEAIYEAMSLMGLFLSKKRFWDVSNALELTISQALLIENSSYTFF